ncbi:hypothetical protein GGC65_000878 [Sphingopyxis sp. OAS728]|nr:hypothetical protein [Sphingopyxis sp. OAS728]
MAADRARRGTVVKSAGDEKLGTNAAFCAANG